MKNNLPELAPMKAGVVAMLLCGCVPQYTPVNCAYHCAPRPPIEYCYDLEPGWVLPQDKYDPHVVLCPPVPVTSQPPNEGDGGDGDGDDGGDDGDDGDEGQSSSTGGGNGAHAEQGNQSSDAVAGGGAEARDGKAGDRNAESPFSGRGRGAGGRAGGVDFGANAGGLL